MEYAKAQALQGKAKKKKKEGKITLSFIFSLCLFF